MSSIILDPFQRIVVLQPTFSISPNITSVDEGNSVVFAVVTEFFGSGTLFWNIEGVSGTITADDFTTPLSGSVAITNNLGTITVNVKEDFNTEGSESFKMNLRTTSTNGPIVAVSATVTINDTSQAPTYSITPNVTSVNEGSSVTFTVTTTGVANGTTLCWSTVSVSGTVNASDFTDFQTTGSVTINNNTATIVRGIRSDFTTEGTESFRLQLLTGSPCDTVVADSAVVTINDTSLNPLIIPPGIPDGGSGALGAQHVRFNPSGTRVAWAHRILAGTSIPTSNKTIVSLYNFSNGNLTKVQDFVNANFPSSLGGTNLVWFNDTTLFVSGTGGSGFADGGITRWTQLAGTFVKTHQNTNFSGALALTPFGLLVGMSTSPRLLSTSDLTQIFQFTADRPAAYCAYSNNTFVFGATGNSPTNHPLTVWNRNSSGVFTKETVLPPFNKYGSQTPSFPSISGLEFNGNTLLVGTSYPGYSPAAVLFRRNGVNSWTRLHEVPSDPEQTNQTGSGWGAVSVAWRNSGEFTIGRFTYVNTPSSLYRYSWNGSTATRIQEIPGTVIQPGAIHYHPNQLFIGVAVFNNQPFFRVYRF